jgi:CHAD domain-containing protein
MHQLRVAIRRLRSGFSVFADALPSGERRRFAAGLKAIARSCGDARELDVFIDELLARATKRLGREPGLAAIRKAALAERQRAWARARRMIDSQRFAGTVLGVEGWIEGGGWRSAAGARASEPARDFARRALKRLHRKTLKSGADLENKDEPALHKLRLRAKRLRYAAEFFAPLFPKKLGRRYVEALADVQERLGALNDAVTVRHVLAVLARRPLGRGEAFERGAALMLGWSAAQVGTELERLPETWSAFADGKTFWK